MDLEPNNDVEHAIARECRALQDLLISKNRSYGSSALDPMRCFSKASPIEQLLVRIDDKLSRLSRGGADDGEDTEKDLAGYLILLRVARAGVTTEAVTPVVDCEKSWPQSVQGGGDGRRFDLMRLNDGGSVWGSYNTGAKVLIHRDSTKLPQWGVDDTVSSGLDQEALTDATLALMREKSWPEAGVTPKAAIFVANKDVRFDLIESNGGSSSWKSTKTSSLVRVNRRYGHTWTTEKVDSERDFVTDMAEDMRDLAWPGSEAVQPGLFYYYSEDGDALLKLESVDDVECVWISVESGAHLKVNRNVVSWRWSASATDSDRGPNDRPSSVRAPQTRMA